jgi:hypothetical protein
MNVWLWLAQVFRVEPWLQHTLRIRVPCLTPLARVDRDGALSLVPAP